MQKQSYPFCPHGVYVGGCGVDHMCHACEMGDEAPTAAEQRAYMRGIYRRGMQPILRVQGALPPAAPLPGPTPPDFRMAQMSVLGYLYQNLARNLREEAATLREIEAWSSSENDDRWIYTRHEARIAEWNAQSGDDQFAGLPDHVLEGA